MAPVGVGFADKLQAPTRVWSIGPLAKGETVMGFAVGPGGPTFTGPHVDSQTGSVFSATRSVVFAGNRLVLALSKGRRNSEGGQFPERIYELLSLDTQTGEVKETREIAAFRPVHLFATNDSHVIVAGRRMGNLQELVRANPGMDAMELKLSTITRGDNRPGKSRTCLRTVRRSGMRPVQDLSWSMLEP